MTLLLPKCKNPGMGLITNHYELHTQTLHSNPPLMPAYLISNN